MSAQDHNHSDPADLARLQGALSELRLINSLISRISQMRELNHMMDLMLGELVKATGADQGIINLVSPLTEGEAMRIVVRASTSKDTDTFKTGDLLCGWVLSKRILLKVDDLDRDERFRGMSSHDGQFKSIICCPMMVRDEIIGLTSLVRGDRKGPFTDDHCRLVGILTSQSAQLLANARLLEELAAKNELLELSRQKLREENVRLQSEITATYGFEQMVGKSAAMKQLLGFLDTAWHWFARSRSAAATSPTA